MQHFLLAIEGVLTFISPCLLPMLPIYFAYLTGQAKQDTDYQENKGLFTQAVFFVLGFTVVFITMGIFVTTIGRFVLIHRTLIQYIAGSFMILLGIDYLLGNPVMNRMNLLPTNRLKQSNSFVFGIIFSLTWTPCVGTFLASALSYAATSTSYFESVTLLLSYSIGLGIPFLLSALLLNEMNHVLDWVKDHYRLIQRVSAVFLILMGISTLFGWLEKVLIYLS